MTVFLFSLIGIPLTAGFTGKFLIFFRALTVPGDAESLFTLLAFLAPSTPLSALGTIFGSSRSCTLPNSVRPIDAAELAGLGYAPDMCCSDDRHEHTAGCELDAGGGAECGWSRRLAQSLAIRPRSFRCSGSSLALQPSWHLPASSLPRSGPPGEARGLDGTSTEKNLPIKWSRARKYRLEKPCPGIGHSSPVVLGEHVFVTSCLLETKEHSFLP